MQPAERTAALTLTINVTSGDLIYMVFEHAYRMRTTTLVSCHDCAGFILLAGVPQNAVMMQLSWSEPIEPPKGLLMVTPYGPHEQVRYCSYKSAACLHHRTQQAAEPQFTLRCVCECTYMFGPRT